MPAAAMILPIVIYGNPVLREDCAPVTEVTEEIRTLAANMIETMIEADGVGLAAPQVAVPVKLAVIDVAHAPDLQTYFRVDGKDADLKEWMPLIFINPELTLGKRKVSDKEGCLSFPEMTTFISRPNDVTAKLTLLDGRVITIETDGLLSRAIQHETDHLHGRLFIDRMNAADKLSLKKKIRAMQDEWGETR